MCDTRTKLTADIIEIESGVFQFMLGPLIGTNGTGPRLGGNEAVSRDRNDERTENT